MPNQYFEIVALFAAITLLVLILVGFIISILYLYQKRHLAYVKYLDELKVAHENELIRTELAMQEQTLVNVSKEIHDHIGLSLTLAKLKMETLTVKEPEKVEIVNKVNEIICQAINQLSSLTKSLDSDFIKRFGLLKGIETELRNVESLELHTVTFTVEGIPRFLEKETEVTLFRIIQESLNNLLKHSGADKINLSVLFTETDLQIRLSDNGKGFNVKEVMNGGCGLTNIMFRAKSINGICDIQSEISEGTLVHLSIPY